MSALTKTAQVLSISISLLGSGGIATLSFFDIPEIAAQPADRALPAIRWLFSRGSHIFPSASVISSAGFALLAYQSLPQNLRTLSQLLKTTNGLKVNGYIAAAILAFSIAPWTAMIMVPNNFALIKKNEELGGARSSASAEERRRLGIKPGQHSVDDSINGKGAVNQYTDLSGPQTKTEKSSSETENKEVKQMLEKFGRQNLVRAVLLGAGGIVGLLTALA